MQRVEDFILQVPGRDNGQGKAALGKLLEGRKAKAGTKGLLDFVGTTATAAVQQASELQVRLQRYSAKAEYPSSELARSLQLCARMSVAGLGTQLYHLGLSGFDTHAHRRQRTRVYCGQLDRSLDAFLADLQAHGLIERTVVLVHSEFGRRAAENRSQGTDHGAAGPAFLFGGGVVAGQHGTRPDFEDLIDGDVRPTTDFRSIYRALLQWLQVDDVAVLGEGLPTALRCIG